MSTPTVTRTLRLGTRASALATTQSGQIARLVGQIPGLHVELVTVTTTGDTDPRSLTEIGGTGVFAAALRTALLAGQVDLAVHSLKDLPVAPAAGLTVAAVPVREDPADVLVARDGLTLDALPVGARVGTGSPRRAAQLRAIRPDLDVVDVRGNVDTRLAAVTAGRLDAVVLARAGLARLGRLDAVTEVFSAGTLLPAPGQGALAVECRSGDDLTTLLATFDDPPSRLAVTAERAVLAELQAGCSTPIGALATVDGDGLLLRASVGGSLHAELRAESPATSHADPLAAAEQVGRAVARALLDRGAGAFLTGPPPRGDATSGRRTPDPAQQHEPAPTSMETH